MPPPPLTTFEDLLGMDRRGLQAVMARAHPIEREALAGQQYHGTDLSLPPWVNRLLWKTFRKTFVRDDDGGLRGWNVRMEQHGIDGPRVPMRTADNEPWTFAHYVVRSAHGLRFPGGWRGADYLDYRNIGNPFAEATATTPLVAVNAGDMDLLLGWEVLQVGPFQVPLPDYWALRREGPVEHMVPARRRSRP